MSQWFEIEMDMLDQSGQRWIKRRIQLVRADDPEAALTRILRRKVTAQILLSEQPIRFVVRDIP